MMTLKTGLWRRRRKRLAQLQGQAAGDLSGHTPTAGGEPPGPAGPAGASVPLADGGVARLVGPAHRDAVRLVTWTEGGAPGADPRQLHRASDTAIAGMCQHLATMDQFVYPEVRGVLPSAAGRARRLRALGQNMMTTMREIQQCAWGDVHAPGALLTELRDELAALITEHGRVEEQLLRDYDEAVSPAERRALAAEYERLLPRAPSRPHPYISRLGPFAGRLPWGLMGRFDRMLNTMDSRAVPGAPVREPGEVGPWGAWLLGRPPQAPARTPRERVYGGPAPENAGDVHPGSRPHQSEPYPAEPAPRGTVPEAPAGHHRPRRQATSTGRGPGPSASQPLTRPSSPRG
jgi:hypothetical protein